jgi:mercuric reductase
LAAASGEEAIPADFSVTPGVIFTDPQVAAVGMMDEEARAAGVNPKETTLMADHLPRVAVSLRSRGMIKLVADAASDRLVAAHVVAPIAGELGLRGRADLPRSPSTGA